MKRSRPILHPSQMVSAQNKPRVAYINVFFYSDEHTEDLLAIHEEEIRRLKEERKLKGSLLKSIQKYFDICQDEKDLAAAAADGGARRAGD